MLLAHVYPLREGVTRRLDVFKNALDSAPVLPEMHRRESGGPTVIDLNVDLNVS